MLLKLAYAIITCAAALVFVGLLSTIYHYPVGGGLVVGFFAVGWAGTYIMYKHRE